MSQSFQTTTLEGATNTASTTTNTATTTTNTGTTTTNTATTTTNTATTTTTTTTAAPEKRRKREVASVFDSDVEIMKRVKRQDTAEQKPARNLALPAVDSTIGVKPNRKGKLAKPASCFCPEPQARVRKTFDLAEQSWEEDLKDPGTQRFKDFKAEMEGKLDEVYWALEFYAGAFIVSFFETPEPASDDAGARRKRGTGLTSMDVEIHISNSTVLTSSKLDAHTGASLTTNSTDENGNVTSTTEETTFESLKLNAQPSSSAFCLLEDLDTLYPKAPDHLEHSATEESFPFGVPVGVPVEYSCVGTKVLDESVDPDGNGQFGVVCGKNGRWKQPSWPAASDCKDYPICKAVPRPEDPLIHFYAPPVDAVEETLDGKPVYLTKILPGESFFYTCSDPSAIFNTGQGNVLEFKCPEWTPPTTTTTTSTTTTSTTTTTLTTTTTTVVTTTTTAGSLEATTTNTATTTTNTATTTTNTATTTTNTATTTTNTATTTTTTTTTEAGEKRKKRAAWWNSVEDFAWELNFTTRAPSVWPTCLPRCTNWPNAAMIEVKS